MAILVCEYCGSPGEFLPDECETCLTLVAFGVGIILDPDLDVGIKLADVEEFFDLDVDP